LITGMLNPVDTHRLEELAQQWETRRLQLLRQYRELKQTRAGRMVRLLMVWRPFRVSALAALALSVPVHMLSFIVRRAASVFTAHNSHRQAICSRACFCEDVLCLGDWLIQIHIAGVNCRVAMELVA